MKQALRLFHRLSDFVPPLQSQTSRKKGLLLLSLLPNRWLTGQPHAVWVLTFLFRAPLDFPIAKSSRCLAALILPNLSVALDPVECLPAPNTAPCFGGCTLEPGCLDLSPSSTTYRLWNSRLFHLSEPQFPHLKRGITKVHTSQGCYGNPLGLFQNHTTMRVSGI